MRIAEIFHSRQGEGRLTGTESCFVRFSGCNLRCTFCDTPYASWKPEGENLSTEELIARIEACPARHVVLTGGEPMIFAELPRICAAIQRGGRHITIETAGTLFQDVACDLMSISPKLSNSTPSAEQAGTWRARHDSLRHRPEVIRKLIQSFPYQLKFVVDLPADLAEIELYLQGFPEVDPAHIWLMPQGIDSAELQHRGDWIRPYCHTRGFHWCPRMHIEWYGNRRGT